MLLIVFVHGFKGTEDTFGQFPEQLKHILARNLNEVAVHCLVFPMYETKGDLTQAVSRFADWLTTVTVQKENENAKGAGSVQIVLCGHSMGGFLIADALMGFIHTRLNPGDPLWPRVIACIAFDTPYLGIHSNVVKNTVSKAVEYADTAKAVGSTILGALTGFGAKQVSDSNPPSTSAATSFSKWTRYGGPIIYATSALAAGIAAGGAYYQREQLGSGLAWATDHMKYIGTLWDEPALVKRLEALARIEEQGVLFRTFYTLIPPDPPFRESRTFIVLPKKTSREISYFLPARNTIAPDEIQSHIGIFAGKTNDGYHDLSLSTARLIQESVTLAGSSDKKGCAPGL